MKPLRTVNHVMTHAVISVDREAAFKDIVEFMRPWRISAQTPGCGEPTVRMSASVGDEAP
jgi:predicted transcriptional regulator